MISFAFLFRCILCVSDMRDILLALIVFGSLPIIVARPYVGVLVWAWLGYMNPHRLSWGFAYDFPFAYIVAIVTLISVFLSKEPKRLPMTGLIAIWILFIAWMGVTTVFAFYPEDAWVQYEKVLKIQLMTFATILLITNRERLRMLLWVIALSLAYFGIKGGIFTIINGGEYRVWGPPDTLSRRQQRTRPGAPDDPSGDAVPEDFVGRTSGFAAVCWPP